MHPYTKLITDLIKESPNLYDRPRLDYYEFRDRWLPLFNKDSNDGFAPLGEWVQAVGRGNSFMEVDIVKGGRTIPDEMYPPYSTVVGGEVMFTVPPILNRAVEISLESGRVLDNVVIESQKRREGFFAAGEQYYKDEMINGVKITVPVDPLLFEKMNDIFEHFGIKRTTFRDSEKKTEVSNTVDSNTAGKIDNDLLDFSF